MNSADTVSNESWRCGLTHGMVEHVAGLKSSPANLAHYWRLLVLQRYPFDATHAVVIDEVRTA